MKTYLTILFSLLSFFSFGQKTDWEKIYGTPQGKKGIKVYTQLIKSDSNNAELFWRRGIEYNNTKQYSLAIIDFDLSIAKDSTFNHSNVLEDRGFSKEMSGNFQEAIIDYTKAISYAFTQDTTLPQGFEKYYYDRGRAKFKMKDTINAIKDLDSSLTWWSQHYYCRKLRAMLLASIGQYEMAMNDYNFLLFKWQGNGDFLKLKEYAIDFFWRAKTKQALGDNSYLKDLQIAEKLKYKQFKATDL